MRSDWDQVWFRAVVCGMCLLMGVILGQAYGRNHPDPSKVRVRTVHITPETLAPTTTTSSSTSTTAAPAPPRSTTTAKVSRSHSRFATGYGDVASDHTDAFWRRLADCENRNGDDDDGYFQFTDPDTARKAGYVRGSSYEEQKKAAIRWAHMIHPNEGTTAGWPNCWWVALRGGN